MYHSITFGDKNTWTDWHIVASERPVFSPPSPKFEFIEIPGRASPIDMTETLTGKPTYSQRTGSFDFYVVNGYNRWNELYQTILNHLHGKKLRAILEDEPEYYYEGRFSVNSWKSQKDWSRITISYTVDPYKYPVSGYGDPIL